MSVAVLRSRLSEDDVHRLVRGDSIETRALAASKICKKIGAGDLDADEREAADAVLAIIAEDAAEMVRRALAITLKNSPHLPPRLARALADDIESIATPILEHSPVLTDEDLIDIARAGAANKQIAIASRRTLSRAVVRVIVDHGAETAVARAAGNDGADWDDTAYVRALRLHGDSAMVTDAFIARAELPMMVAEKLVSLISDTALERLVRRHALPPQLAVEIAEGARERATIDLLDQAGCQSDMRRFVQQLQLNARLTPSIILRGLCMGHMRFFEHAIAELVGAPHQKAWILIHDAGPLGLKAVFDRAGLPARLFPAIRAGVDIYHEIEHEGAPEDRAHFTRTMIERVLTRRAAMAKDDTDYLLDKLDALGGRSYEMIEEPIDDIDDIDETAEIADAG